MKYSDHALRRMRQRQITKREVEEALGDVIITYPSDHGSDCQVLIGHTKSGRELKIIVNHTDGVIVTIAPTRV